LKISCHNFSTKTNWTFGFIAFFFSLFVFAQGAGFDAALPKKKEEKIKRDPAFGAFRFENKGEDFKAAKERAKVPGRLVAEKNTADFIYSIELKGLSKVDPDAVLAQLKSMVDQKVDADNIAEDIRRIYRMGLFDDVTVYKIKNADGGWDLSYELREKPVVHEISLKGNTIFSAEEIKAVVSLSTYFVADEDRLNESIEKIKGLYRDKGYFLAQVSAELKPVKGDIETQVAALVPGDLKKSSFVDVLFNIQENQRVSITDIQFIGNQEVDSKTLKDVLFSKEKHLLSPVTKWGIYNEQALQADQFLIEEEYQRRGFLNVQIAKPRVSLSADKNAITIVFSIKEGKQYRLGSLDITGDFIATEEDYWEKIAAGELAFRKERLLQKISVKSGEVFNRSKFRTDLLAFVEMYKDEGYYYANVVPQSSIDEEKSTIDVVLQMQAGPKVRIERISIVGNSHTSEEVIRRELRVFEGDVYSSTLIRLSEMRIRQLGFLERVQLHTREGSAPDRVVIEVEVKEGRSGNVQVGGGYSPGGEGFVFRGQVSENNLFGRGQTLTAQVQWSSQRRVFDIRFIEPYLTYLANAPLTFSFSIYSMERWLPSFSRSSLGGQVMFGYPFLLGLTPISQQWLKDVTGVWEDYVPDFENLRLFLSYSVERVFVTNDSQDDRLYGLHLNQPRYTTSLRSTLQLDQRNNRMFPTAGYFFETHIEWASSYMGSRLLSNIENSFRPDVYQGIRSGLNMFRPMSASNDFIRYGFNTKFYYNFDSWFWLKGWTLKFNLDMEWMKAFGDSLVSDNFFAGGIGTVRGYFIYSISPTRRLLSRYVDEPAHFYRMGGDKKLFLNMELEFPIVQALRLSWVFFFDAGNVYGEGENFFYAGNSLHPSLAMQPFAPERDLPLGLYWAAGFGVRWFSPLGALRFEWGFPLVRRPKGTPGWESGDGPVFFEFSIGSGI